MTGLVEFSKGLNLKEALKARYLQHAPLKPNEFWHGTQHADAIRREGFRLADPTKRFVRSEQGLGRSGRQVAGTHSLGPGVYVTRSRAEASSYAQGNMVHFPTAKWDSIRQKTGKPEILRVQVPKGSKFMVHNEQKDLVQRTDKTGKKLWEDGKEGGFPLLRPRNRTPEATRQGYAGLQYAYTRSEGDVALRPEHVVSNPRNVKVVRNRYRPTKQAYKDAAVLGGVGGTGGLVEMKRRHNKDK